MRGLFILLLAASAPTFTQAQGIPELEWQACFGGSGFELGYSIQQTSDGGYIFAGETRSNNGQVTGFHGDVDWWVVRTDATGELLWQRALGGSGAEIPRAIVQTTDGGFVVAGSSGSVDGDLTGVPGSGPGWMVKLDTSGDIQWQYRYTGTFWALQQTDDGFLFGAGNIQSTLDIPSCNQGADNAWFVKLDEMGILQWERCYGGSSSDLFLAMDTTDDGGCILAGWTFSNNGDVSTNNGAMDLWVVMVDQQGGLLWEKGLGGSDIESSSSVKQTNDGGFVVVGSTFSNNGDVIGHHGQQDVWVIKLNASGELLWQRAIGGSDREAGLDVMMHADGGFTIAGWTQSTDGDVSQLAGQADAWLVRLDANGSLLWEKTFGGTGAEQFNSMVKTTDEGFTLCGNTSSNDGDVSGNQGAFDIWLIKLGPEPVGLPEFNQEPRYSIFPNPTQGMLTVEFLLSEALPVGFTWFDASGRTLLVESTTHYLVGKQHITLATEGLPNGPLLLQVQIGEQRLMRQVVKL